MNLSIVKFPKYIQDNSRTNFFCEFYIGINNKNLKRNTTSNKFISELRLIKEVKC